MKERAVGVVKVKSFNRVVGGGPWPQRNTIRDVLMVHKSLSLQLAGSLRGLRAYLQKTESPNKGTVTRYQNEINFDRKRVFQNVKVIQALRRYRLLNLDRNLILPIIPYIFQAVDEESRLQEDRDRLRLSDSFESSEDQIDFIVQQMFAGFIEVNVSAGQFYPGELPEILKFIRSYGGRHKHHKGSSLNVNQYVTQEILDSYILLLRAMYCDIFFPDEGGEKREANQDDAGSPSREALRLVK